MRIMIVTLVMAILGVLSIPTVQAASFNISLFQEVSPATPITPYTVVLFNGSNQQTYINVTNFIVPDIFTYDGFDDDSFNTNNWANESEVCSAISGGRRSLIEEGNGTLRLEASQTGATSQKTEIVSNVIQGNFTEITFNITETLKTGNFVYIGVRLGSQELISDANTVGNIQCLPSQGGALTDLNNIGSSSYIINHTAGGDIRIWRDDSLIRTIVGGNLTNQRLSFIASTNTTTGTVNTTIVIGFVKIDNITFFPNLGDTDVRISSDGFTQRGYRVVLNNETDTELTGYLLSDADSTEITFTVQTGFVNENDALITTQRFIGDSFQTVEQDLTTGAGNALQFMLVGETYRVTASKEGRSIIESISPTSVLFQFTLRLTSAAVQQLNPVFSDVSYRFDPLASTVPFGNASVNLTVIATNNNLNIFGMNVSFTWINGSNFIIFMGNDTTAAGGTISAAFDLTTIFNASNFDTINITAFFNKTNSQTALITRSYTVFSQNASNISIFDTLSDVKGLTGLTDLTASIAALFITVLVAGFASLKLRVGGFGVGFLAILMLGFFTLIEWFDQSMYIILILVSISSYVLFRRGL